MIHFVASIIFKTSWVDFFFTADFIFAVRWIFLQVFQAEMEKKKSSSFENRKVNSRLVV